MLGALLEATDVVGVDGATVRIRLREANPVHAEGLARQREALAEVLGRYATGPVRVALEDAGGASAAPVGRPPRLTEAAAREARLRVLRAKDPGLGAAVDALDLELLE
jgi:hypothetical protein